MGQLNEEPFEANPGGFLDSAIKDYTLKSTSNQLTAFNGEPIFDEPLVGFADGNDPIFQRYKSVIGDYHLTPREVLARQRQEEVGASEKESGSVSVISFILPITYETRLSLRRESSFPSLRWNHSRWQGQEFINRLSSYVVSLLKKRGYQAVAPDLAPFYKVFSIEPDTLVSNWSQRHIAYAAGLGTFSLNDGLITPKGIAMRCGSVVTELALPPSPRLYENHSANCLFYQNRACRRCIERCPVGAISEEGHNKKRCQKFLLDEQPLLLKEMGREQGYVGTYLGCGLCQTKVPCEFRIPLGIRRGK